MNWTANLLRATVEKLDMDVTQQNTTKTQKYGSLDCFPLQNSSIWHAQQYMMIITHTHLMPEEPLDKVIAMILMLRTTCSVAGQWQLVTAQKQIVTAQDEL